MNKVRIQKIFGSPVASSVSEYQRVMLKASVTDKRFGTRADKKRDITMALFEIRKTVKGILKSGAAALVVAGVSVVTAPSAEAQTSTGTLTVTATVASSIGLTFETDGSGVALTGAGTSAATLGFGTVSAFGTIGTANVTRTVAAADFTVSTPFGVKVVRANSNSADYTLTAALGLVDAVNTWTVDTTDLTTAPQTLGSTYAYGSAVSHSMKLKVPFTAAAGAVSRNVNFTATAN